MQMGDEFLKLNFFQLFEQREKRSKTKILTQKVILLQQYNEREVKATA